MPVDGGDPLRELTSVGDGSGEEYEACCLGHHDDGLLPHHAALFVPALRKFDNPVRSIQAGRGQQKYSPQRN